MLSLWPSPKKLKKDDETGLEQLLHRKWFTTGNCQMQNESSAESFLSFQDDFFCI